MKTRFLSHVDSIKNLALANTCAEILDTPEFLTWPASLSFHHAYERGLLAHTVEVADIAFGMSRLTCNENLVKPWMNHDILIAAALWHDSWKVREYELVSKDACEASGTRHLPTDGKAAWIKRNSLFGNHAHIVQSTIEFTAAARKHGVTEDVIEQVQHCILAHHGRKEWGSPVEPQTLEALILHQADMLSAKFGTTKDAP